MNWWNFSFIYSWSLYDTIKKTLDQRYTMQMKELAEIRSGAFINRHYEETILSTSFVYE